MKKNFKFSNTGNIFLLAFGLYYAVSIIYELVVSFVFRSSDSMPAAIQWCSYLLNPIIFISIPLVYARKKNVNIVSAAKLNKKINIKQVGILALLSVACIMAFLPISNIFLDLLSRLGFKMSLSFADTSSSVGAYFLGLLMLAVFPALAEEFLMRGAILNAAEQRKDYSYAILVTAAMFSLMHGNPIQTVHQFLLGIVLAYIVLVSRSLWSAVLLHFFNNFLSLSLDYPYQWFLNATGAYKMSIGYKYVIWVVCIFIGGTIVMYLLKKFTKLSTEKSESEPEIIDVVQNDDGVFTAENQAKAKTKKAANDFENAFQELCGIFKKGGFKSLYNRVNSTIRNISSNDYDEEYELTREDYLPSNIKLVFIILGVIWLFSLITGFLI